LADALFVTCPIRADKAVKAGKRGESGAGESGAGPSRMNEYQGFRTKTGPFFGLKTMFSRPKKAG